MKKLLAILFLQLVCFVSHGTAIEIGRQTSSDFTTAGSSGAITCSTSTWTKVPTTSDSRRWALIVDNDARNNNKMLLRLSSDGLSPSSTSYGLTLSQADVPWLLSISGDIQAYCLSLHTAAEVMFYTELK